MSVVIARSPEGTEGRRGNLEGAGPLNGGERLLPPINLGRNDMHIRGLAAVTSEVNTLIECPRIKVGRSA